MILKFKFILLTLISFINKVYSGALQLNNQNYDPTLNGHELVFVNFYANWCRFSQMLEPIFDEFADRAAKELPVGKAAVAKVDCDVETHIAQQNQINKYPTLKLYRHGTAIKKEYRGARSVDAFLNFVKEQLENPLKIVNNYGDLSRTLSESKKRMIIGYFPTQETESYKTFFKLSSLLRDSCTFIAAVGDVPTFERNKLENVVFRESFDQHDLEYEGDLTQYESLYAWANEKCTPLVREITFENAEELTEEGLPFLILFHKPEDTESVKVFEKEVQRQLIHYKNTINAVHADGNKFSHPLHHLGKTVSDLPVLAIDSFRHMYLFPDYNKLTQDNHLAQFVIDLHSGKLHREFHNGPDPVTEAPKQIEQGNNHLPKALDDQNKQKISTPPESVFIKLAPSRERYSIKYDGDL